MDERARISTKIIEELFLDKVTLVAMIMTYRQHFPKIGDWEADFKKTRAEFREQSSFQQKFAEISEALSKAHQTYEEISELLKNFGSDVVH